MKFIQYDERAVGEKSNLSNDEDAKEEDLLILRLLRVDAQSASQTEVLTSTLKLTAHESNRMDVDVKYELKSERSYMLDLAETTDYFI